MKRQLISISKPTRAELQKLTTSNIALKVMKKMKAHIGEGKSITRGAMFKYIFNRTEADTLEDWLRWEFVKKGMHLCRQRTKCFIASKREKGIWRYFVINDEFDAKYYVDILEKNIKRMRLMQRRAMKAGVEKWGSLPTWGDTKLLK